MKKISSKDVEDVAFRVARKFREYGEPIPEFSTRTPETLESCLNTPFQTFSKKHLYPGFISKASILFYLIIKNHPLQNGNKRLAITTLQLFLLKNNKWLNTDEESLYSFTIWVAESLAMLQRPVVKCIEYYIQKHLVKIDIDHPEITQFTGQPLLF